MLTDNEINDLIALPKTIIVRKPAKGYSVEGLHRRADLDLHSSAPLNPQQFSMFIRQNTRFTENFSVGLRYHSNLPSLGTIIMVRYNGPHGDAGIHPDGHYAKPHVHRITSAELTSGSRAPREQHREITNRYATLEAALRVFLIDIGATPITDFFPGLAQEQLFNGC